MDQKTITMMVDEKVEGQLDKVFKAMGLDKLDLNFTPSQKLRAALTFAADKAGEDK